MITLGVDTSNYTTSIALSNDYNEVILDLRRPLKVPNGSIGLRQSDAYYQHIQNLSQMLDEISKYAMDIEKIVISTQPRNLENSYMPVFNAGVFFVKAMNFNNQYEIIELSHQEGHILSGWCEYFSNVDEFFLLHISGGTTELLKVKKTNARLKSQIVYESLDISFGQLLDRIGNYMNLDFPAGMYLDKIADKYIKTNFKISANEKGFNLSGMENKFKNIYDETSDSKYVANLTFSYLVEIIESINYRFVKNQPLLIVGGVGESRFLRDNIAKSNIVFTKKNLSRDNAVGLSQYPFILEEI
jgi:N6-L-threonylcarbamoyladenine synthase